MTPKQQVRYLAEQDKYIKRLEKNKGNPFSWVSTGEFLLSMRQFGYQTTFAALAEFIDNSIEALASKIIIVINTVKANSLFKVTHPGDIAVYDNGKGMEPTMIRAALRWGGTHRYNDRNNMGRFGVGLPGATGSMSENYTVYSGLNEKSWHAVHVNLIDLAEESYKGEDVDVPEPESSRLPNWVYNAANGMDFSSGTAVVLKNPDMLTGGYVQPASFLKNIMRYCGVTYRNYLLEHEIYVVEYVDSTGKYGELNKVQAIDPLFLMPDGRGYQTRRNDWLAENWGEKTIRMTTKEGNPANIKIRYSMMDPKFTREKGNDRIIKERSSILAENNAQLILTRRGRQVALVQLTKFPTKSLNKGTENDDRFWAIEVDFPASLDEEFNMPSNKQSAEPSDRVYDRLEKAGVPQQRREMANEWKKRQSVYVALKDKKPESDDRSKISERILEAVNKDHESDPKDDELKEALKKKRSNAKSKYKTDGKTNKEAESEAEKIGLGFELRFDRNGETAPFYDVQTKEATVIIIINQDHAFYTYLFGHPNTGDRNRQSLELIIGALGSCEATSGENTKQFYRNQRVEWSRKIDNYLRMQEGQDPTDFETSSIVEEELRVEVD